MRRREDAFGIHANTLRTITIKHKMERVLGMAQGNKQEWEKRLADAVSSGGVSFSRAAVEILYLLPDELVEWYSLLFHAALTGADGGAGQRGEADARKRDEGRASGVPVEAASTRRGRIRAGETTRAHGRAAKNTGVYRGVWAIGDEAALRLKQKIDKRLRSVARDIRDELEVRMDEKGKIVAARLKSEGEGVEGGGGQEVQIQVCVRCRRFVQEQWNYCPFDGVITKWGWERIEKARNPDKSVND